MIVFDWKNQWKWKRTPEKKTDKTCSSNSVLEFGLVVSELVVGSGEQGIQFICLFQDCPQPLDLF